VDIREDKAKSLRSQQVTAFEPGLDTLSPYRGVAGSRPSFVSANLGIAGEVNVCGSLPLLLSRPEEFPKLSRTLATGEASHTFFVGRDWLQKVRSSCGRRQPSPEENGRKHPDARLGTMPAQP
jgi:hypothetical protein